MKTTTIITGLTALLLTLLAGLPDAWAGMVRAVNNSNFVLVIGVTYSDGSKSSPEIINPNNAKSGLGSPVKTVTGIRVVNTTDGTDPNKALLKEYQESAPSIMRNYIVTVSNVGAVEIAEQAARGGVTLPK